MHYEIAVQTWATDGIGLGNDASEFTVGSRGFAEGKKWRWTLAAVVCGLLSGWPVTTNWSNDCKIDPLTSGTGWVWPAAEAGLLRDLLTRLDPTALDWMLRE